LIHFYKREFSRRWCTAFILKSYDSQTDFLATNNKIMLEEK